MSSGWGVLYHRRPGVDYPELAAPWRRMEDVNILTPAFANRAQAV